MPGHFSKWVFGAGSWNRTLLRPLHPLTWYCRTWRYSAPLSGKRASMNNRLLTSFPVFSLFCSGYLSREGFCFVLPTCDFLLPCWGGLLRSTVSCEGHIHGPTLCKFSFNFQTTEIRSCPDPFVVLFLFHVGLFLLSCGQGSAPNTQHLWNSVGLLESSGEVPQV